MSAICAGVQGLDAGWLGGNGQQHIDKDKARFMEEPRATSAPPHQQDGFNMNDSVSLRHLGAQTALLEQAHGDFHNDEDYAHQYKQLATHSMRPPVDNRILYQELGLLSPQHIRPRAMGVGNSIEHGQGSVSDILLALR
eukprot:gene21446-28414_t